MNYRVVLSEIAVIEIREAIIWYDEISKELGKRLENIIFEELSLLQKNPFICQKIFRDIRAKYIKNFPFGIHYVIENDFIKVYAFFHMKRDPMHWKDRRK